MESVLAGLLHDCAGEPDDLAPRLILADWLEDHGQPERATFVRVQCRLAAWVLDWRERRSLIAQQAGQFEKQRAAWLGKLPEYCEHIEFVGGLCRIWVTGQTLSQVAFRSELADRAGTALIESLRITHTGKLRRIASLDVLERVPALSFACLGLGNDALTDLLASPRLERLAALDLSNNRLGDGAADLLSRSGLLSRLARLEIRNNALSPAAVHKLLDATFASKMRDLDLMGNTFDALTVPRIAEWRAARAGTPSGPARRVMNSLGMEFAHIPAGSFRMGSTKTEEAVVDRSNEHTKHTVTLTQPYYLGRFVVTQQAFAAVMGSNPARFHDNPAHPVENVDLESVLEFCQRLSDLPAERAARRSYRLPTEAEWEHACRAGTFTPFHFGAPPSTDFINYDGRYNYGGAPRGDYLERTQPVGTYPPNAFGLYEMHGNVWEWCSDVYQENYARNAVVDPTGPLTTENAPHAIRGGCWEAVGAYCRSAHRYGEEPDTRDDYTGFRVVLVTAE